MDHDLELIIPILEILEIAFFSFPRILEILEIQVFQFSTILEIWEIEVSMIPRVLEIWAVGGRLQGFCCAALDYFWDPVPGLGICRDVFTTFALLWNHPAGAFFPPKTTFL